MSAHSEPTVGVAGEYVVVNQGSGQGIDYYLQVVGPDGRASEQKVYWMYSMTPYQVAEKAVAAHLGVEAVRRSAATRPAPERGYVVTVDEELDVE